MYSELFINVLAFENGSGAIARHVYSGISAFGSKRSQNRKLRWYVISLRVTARVYADMLISAIMRRRVNRYEIELEIYHHATGKPPTKHMTSLFRTDKGWYRFDFPLDLDE